MYVAVKGGEKAIRAAHALQEQKRRGDGRLPELSVEQIGDQLSLAVDRVMTEGGIADRELAALALKQASGDSVEAIFLLRAYRTTLQRLAVSEPVDTAGMRRKSKVDDAIEKYSNMRSVSAIDRADVCLILIDANEGVTEQDTKVAGLAHEAGKASIIVVNKWDLIEKDGKTMDKMREEVRNGLAFMTYAPILFISAKTGQRVDRLFELIDYVSNQASTRITTGMLNSVLADAQTRVQPPSDKGRRLKIYYMTQVGIRPPHFVVFCNDSRLFHFSYQRYLENCLRNTFGLEGTPITLSIRQRGEKEG